MVAAGYTIRQVQAGMARGARQCHHRSIGHKTPLGFALAFACFARMILMPARCKRRNAGLWKFEKRANPVSLAKRRAGVPRYRLIGQLPITGVHLPCLLRSTYNDHGKKPPGLAPIRCMCNLAYLQFDLSAIPSTRTRVLPRNAGRVDRPEDRSLVSSLCCSK